MEDTHLAEENYSHAATFSLGDLCAEFSKEGFDVAPLNIGAGRMGEHEFERASVLPLHGHIWYQKAVLTATTRVVEGSDG